jgi:DNA-binding transcriptional MocR family regulator
VCWSGVLVAPVDAFWTGASGASAISLHKALFEQVEALAHEMHISRSRLFVLAVEDFIRRHESQRLLERLNAAYGEAPDAAEQALRRRMRRQHRHVVEGEW